jgi:hypothetical protein
LSLIERYEGGDSREKVVSYWGATYLIEFIHKNEYYYLPLPGIPLCDFLGIVIMEKGNNSLFGALLNERHSLSYLRRVVLDAQ